MKTMWFLGETQTTSYFSVSKPFIRRQPAHPDPTTTTRGFSPAFVGPSPAHADTAGGSGAAAVEDDRRRRSEAGDVAYGFAALLARLLTQAMVLV